MRRLPFFIPDNAIQGDFDALNKSKVEASSGPLTIVSGVKSTWNWSGSYTTDVSIAHGLGVTPDGFLTSGVIRASEMTTDARAPYIVAPVSSDATNITVRVMTFNKAVIGVFAANEPIHWVAWVAA